MDAVTFFSPLASCTRALILTTFYLSISLYFVEKTMTKIHEITPTNSQKKYNQEESKQSQAKKSKLLLLMMMTRREKGSCLFRSFFLWRATTSDKKEMEARFSLFLLTAAFARVFFSRSFACLFLPLRIALDLSFFNFFTCDSFFGRLVFYTYFLP